MRRSNFIRHIGGACLATALITGCNTLGSNENKPAPVAASPAPVPVATAAPPPVPAPTSIRITIEAYTPISTAHPEPRNFGMYTYVLFGRSTGGKASLSADTKKRYENLLSAIETSVPTRVDVFSREKNSEYLADAMKRTNLYCVPSRASTFDLSLDTYNAAQAFYLRSVALNRLNLDKKLTARLERGSGPFLISTLRPLDETHAGDTVLISDLSKLHPDAVDLFFKDYQVKIANHATSDKPLFQSVRANFKSRVEYLSGDVTALLAAIKHIWPDQPEKKSAS